MSHSEGKKPEIKLPDAMPTLHSTFGCTIPPSPVLPAVRFTREEIHFTAEGSVNGVIRKDGKADLIATSKKLRRKSCAQRFQVSIKAGVGINNRTLPSDGTSAYVKVWSEIVDKREAEGL